MEGITSIQIDEEKILLKNPKYKAREHQIWTHWTTP